MFAVCQHWLHSLSPSTLDGSSYPLQGNNGLQCVCVILGLSKWVRQLVQHHDTFSNAMQSLVAFSQVQQKAEAAPADSQIPSSTVSSPNCHLPVTVEGQGLPKAPEPQTPSSCVKPPEPQQNSSPSSLHSFPRTQLKAEQNEAAGELLYYAKMLKVLKEEGFSATRWRYHSSLTKTAYSYFIMIILKTVY